MLTSTEMYTYKKLGDLKAILRLLRESGFEAYDFSMFHNAPSDEILLADDYVERAKDLRAYADSIGLPCNQTHAPFATAKKGNEEYNDKMRPQIKRAIEISGILGAKVCVVHPCNDYTAEENAEMYREFEPVARRAGVRIGVENMWNHRKDDRTRFAPAACSHHEDFKRHMDLLPADVFVACLDIGHCYLEELDTDAVKMIDTLGDRLQAIHLHDVDFKHDSHMLPFTQKIDYAPIIEAFRRNHYQGDITLEANGAHSKFPVELLPAYAHYAAEVAMYFKRKVLEE
ncbi:MAG: sugar phosphate isomerase/epimerase [Clostridia bacterium]|nr:sugar phosphate isomerase/epimerase [Clostridia bacterium]